MSPRAGSGNSLAATGLCFRWAAGCPCGLFEERFDDRGLAMPGAHKRADRAMLRFAERPVVATVLRNMTLCEFDQCPMHGGGLRQIDGARQLLHRRPADTFFRILVSKPDQHCLVGHSDLPPKYIKKIAYRRSLRQPMMINACRALVMVERHAAVARRVIEARPRGPLRLLARGVGGDPGGAARRGVSLGPADGPHLAALSSSAEELIDAIELEPRNIHSGRHLDTLQDLPRSRIDSPQFALVAFPGGVPELSVDPGDPGDEPVGLDRAKNRACFGVNLMNLPVPILPDPERPFGPREPRVTAAAGRRDRGEHTARLRIDLLDAILGELKQVLAVEGRSRMRGDIDRAQRLPARRIDGDQLVSRGEPDVMTVIRDATHVVGTWKGSVLADDLGG